MCCSAEYLLRESTRARTRRKNPQEHKVVVMVEAASHHDFREMEINILRKFHGAERSISMFFDDCKPDLSTTIVKDDSYEYAVQHSNMLSESSRFRSIASLDENDVLQLMTNGAPIQQYRKQPLAKPGHRRTLVGSIRQFRSRRFTTGMIRRLTTAISKSTRVELSVKPVDTGDTEDSDRSTYYKYKDYMRRYHTIGGADDPKHSADSVMRCLSAIIITQMNEYEKNNIDPPNPESKYAQCLSFLRDNSDAGTSTGIPSVETVYEFVSEAYGSAQMEYEGLVVGLIYLERVVKVTSGEVGVTRNNWRSLVFACLIVASKMWDDFAMLNRDLAKIFDTEYTLHRIVKIEAAVLRALDFQLSVTAAEYAKYFFHLGTMTQRAKEAKRRQESKSPQRPRAISNIFSPSTRMVRKVRNSLFRGSIRGNNRVLPVTTDATIGNNDVIVEEEEEK